MLAGAGLNEVQLHEKIQIFTGENAAHLKIKRILHSVAGRQGNFLYGLVQKDKGAAGSDRREESPDSGRRLDQVPELSGNYLLQGNRAQPEGLPQVRLSFSHQRQRADRADSG